MERGCFFVIPGIHPCVEFGIIGLYNRFAKVMAIRRKSAIGLIFLAGELIATFAFGDESDDQSLLEMAETSRQSFSERFLGSSEIFYEERSLPDDSRLMVVEYQIIVDDNNYVNALDRYSKFAKKKPKRKKSHADQVQEDFNPLSSQNTKRCIWCGTRAGQHHGIICRGEICPDCGSSLLYCDCTKLPEDKQPGEGWECVGNERWPLLEKRMCRFRYIVDTSSS